MRNYGRWWTDYPLFEHECGKKAPIREIKVLWHDDDKYVRVVFEKISTDIKCGYLYPKPRRLNSNKPCKRLKLFMNNSKYTHLE